jgi:hypothetical protein
VSERKKAYIDSADLRIEVARQCEEHCGSVFSLYVCDARYYCPPEADVIAVIAGEKVHETDYIAESHDCDDFARLLVAAFIRDAYREGKRRPAYCFGLVFTLGHALCWLMTDKLEIKLVEPQTGQVMPLSTLKAEGDFILFMEV